VPSDDQYRQAPFMWPDRWEIAGDFLPIEARGDGASFGVIAARKPQEGRLHVGQVFAQGDRTARRVSEHPAETAAANRRRLGIKRNNR
jgi:hypothetical protein